MPANFSWHFLCMKREFLNRLNDFILSLDSIYDVNSGGCAFVSWCIAKNLEKYHSKYKIVLYDGDREVSAKVNFNNNKGVYHVWVRCLGIDINGYNEENVYNKYLISLNSKQIKHYYDKAIWNDSYRKDLNAVISRKINNFFKNNFIC